MNYIDRSRIEADWTCPERRYWNTEYLAPGANRRGIVKVEDATALIFGTAIHNALAGTMLGATPDEDLDVILDNELRGKLTYLTLDKRTELILLARGMFWGFVIHIKPTILDQYTVEAIEHEVGFDLDNHTRFMAKPDLILKRKSDGTYWYPDFKTTGFKTKQWMDSWHYALQVHSGCHAIEETLDITVEGAVIIGLYKGYHDKEGRLRSLFTYAYQNPISKVWSDEYVRGWDLKSLAEYPDGMRAWVSSRCRDVIDEQFPVVPNIMFDRDYVNRWLKEQRIREREIRQFHAGSWNHARNHASTFPRHTKSCIPPMGPVCPYIEACHNPSVAEDPVGSKLYVVREPHHSPEVQAYESGEIKV
jgi:hypothetical protein